MPEYWDFSVNVKKVDEFIKTPLKRKIHLELEVNEENKFCIFF